MDLVRAYVHLGVSGLLVGERAGELDPSFWDELAVQDEEDDWSNIHCQNFADGIPKLRPQFEPLGSRREQRVDAERAAATATPTTTE